MKELLLSVLRQESGLTLEEIVLHIVMSAVFGFAIYISYWYAHSGTAYSRKFNVSLITLAVLTGTVMTVIGNNVALSLGMVGALSIIRFRTAIKDSRDTTYIFWAIIVGICCGVGDYLVAAIGTAVVFIVLLVLGRVRNDERILLVIRGSREHELAVEGLIFKEFSGKAVMKVKNTTEETIEYIYELNNSTYKQSYTNDQSIIGRLYDIGKIEYVNVVAQSDEIGG